MGAIVSDREQDLWGHGGYICKCLECNRYFNHFNKRAVICEPCRIMAMNRMAQQHQAALDACWLGTRRNG